jgi:hypothetical protein
VWLAIFDRAERTSGALGPPAGPRRRDARWEPSIDRDRYDAGIAAIRDTSVR